MKTNILATLTAKGQVKDVPGYEDDYSIIANGTIIRKQKTIQLNDGTLRTYPERRIATFTNVHGYQGTSLNGKTLILHRLLYEAFVGSIPAGYQVHHIDENKQNNSISNLQCLTREEHIKIHNLDAIVKSTKAKQLKKQGLTAAEIAEQLGTSCRTVYNYLSN